MSRTNESRLRTELEKVVKKAPRLIAALSIFGCAKYDEHESLMDPTIAKSGFN